MDIPAVKLPDPQLPRARSRLRIAATWPASAAHTALGAALVTQPAAMTPAVRTRLHALLGRFL